MSNSQRRKGATGERELCTLLSDALGGSFKRKLGQARESGHDVDVPPFSVECKRRQRVANLYDWLAQCEGERPVVMLRADGKQWLAVMPLAEWIVLAREEIAANKTAVAL